MFGYVLRRRFRWAGGVCVGGLLLSERRTGVTVGNHSAFKVSFCKSSRVDRQEVLSGGLDQNGAPRVPTEEV